MLKKCPDFCALSIFIILITLHPYYLRGTMNLYELGLYLPGINGILDGLIPYRDFFYLRGPLGLYVPAFLMKLFGENAAVLSRYFYVGTVLTLILCVLIAQRLQLSRLFLCLMVPVLIGKSFPRVVFTYWGGMRFCLGLLAIYCALSFFQTRKYKWLMFAGAITGLALFTSMEIGACSFMALTGSLIAAWWVKQVSGTEVINGLRQYIFGFFAVLVFIVTYFAFNDALVPMIQAHLNVFKMREVFLHLDPVPETPGQFLLTLVNPESKNFRHITPFYCYLFFTGYLVWTYRRRAWSNRDTAAMCLALYGLIFFFTSFRNIWSSTFQMVLQPDKIILFFLLDRFIAALKTDFGSKTVLWAKVCLVLIILSSVIYPIQRFNRRFFAYQYVRNVLTGQSTEKLIPIHDIRTQKMTHKRLKGFEVPEAQADDFKKLIAVIDQHTNRDDPVLMYPELGAYSFIIDRPFVGRFPMGTFSWFEEDWHREYMEDIREARAEFAVIPRELPAYFDDTRLAVASNQRMYTEVMEYIQTNYVPVATTPTLEILRRR